MFDSIHTFHVPSLTLLVPHVLYLGKKPDLVKCTLVTLRRQSRGTRKHSDDYARYQSFWALPLNGGAYLDSTVVPMIWASSAATA